MPLHSLTQHSAPEEWLKMAIITFALVGQFETEALASHFCGPGERKLVTPRMSDIPAIVWLGIEGTVPS
jgi:hypothetical protein